MSYTIMIRNFIIIVGVALIAASPVYSQVAIGENKTPETFSVMELISDANGIYNRGLRLPHLTSFQRDSITNNTPDAKKKEVEKGLAIFNTTTNCVDVWNGSQWISWCAPQPMLEAKPNLLTFTSAVGGGGVQTVKVTTNQPGWQIDGTVPGWLSLSGAGTGNLTVNVPNANTGNALLTAKIPIATTGGTVILRDTITVVQLY